MRATLRKGLTTSRHWSKIGVPRKDGWAQAALSRSGGILGRITVRNMNVQAFVHSDSAGARASVQAWWVSGSGIHHAYILDRAALPVELGEDGPWRLLNGLWVALRERQQARVD